MVFSSALTLATFVLIAVVARFNSWDQFYFTLFKTYQLLCPDLKFRFRVYIWGLGIGVRLGFTGFSLKQGSPTFLKLRATSCVPINAKGY